ncbi:MAG: hypothetical protein HY535_04835 [Chloroflexi bacterium]|nr:hypothetical protein [Chloroflexota bacterium]
MSLFMTRARTLRPTLAGLALLLALAASAGCAPTLVPQDPKLPPGFVETALPEADMGGYAYLSQTTPLTIPLEWFVPKESLPPGAPVQAGVDRIAVWLGPTDIESFGVLVDFVSAAEASFAEAQVEAQARGTLRVQRANDELLAFQGSGQWTDALRNAAGSNVKRKFSERYTEQWELLRLLPASPPGDPVAAGFLKVNSQLLDSLAAKGGMNLGNVAPALGAVQIGDIAFIAYANAPVTLPARVTPAYLRETTVGALFVVRSTYPGVLVNFFLNNFADRAGLEKGPQVQGQEVLYRNFQDVHLMLKAVGNTLFFSLAPTKEKAEALMASALAPHVKGG